MLKWYSVQRFAQTENSKLIVDLMVGGKKNTILRDGRILRRTVSVVANLIFMLP